MSDIQEGKVAISVTKSYRGQPTVKGEIDLHNKLWFVQDETRSVADHRFMLNMHCNYDFSSE